MSASKKLIPVALICLVVGLGLGGWMLIHHKPASTNGVELAGNFEEVESKAAGGDAAAQKTLGEMYAKGQGVAQNYDEAAKWYRQAADQGYAAAQTALGQLYEAGRGVPHDDTEAAKWYQRAAESGDPLGQYSVAILYVMGQGVKQNDAEAVKWYRQAANQGLALAQYNLGMRCWEGKGLPRDPVQAYKWLSLAAAQGIRDADTTLKDVKAKMTREQISEAKSQVKAFVPAKTSKPSL